MSTIFAPQKYIGVIGPGTLLTSVCTARVRPRRLRVRTAVRCTVPMSPPSASSDISISARTGWAPDSFTCEVDATIRASRAIGSASSVAIVIGAMENWLPAVDDDADSVSPIAVVRVLVGRIEIGIIAINDSSGSSSFSRR